MSAIIWHAFIMICGAFLGTAAAFGWVAMASLFAGEWIWHLVIPAVFIGWMAGAVCGFIVAGDGV
jgi:hypothetical protein